MIGSAIHCSSNGKPVIVVSSNNIHIRLLLDTGSDVNLLSTKFKFLLSKRHSTVMPILKTISGSRLFPKGYGNFCFTVDDTCYSADCYLVEFPEFTSFDGIVCWKFLERNFDLFQCLLRTTKFSVMPIDESVNVNALTSSVPVPVNQSWCDGNDDSSLSDCEEALVPSVRPSISLPEVNDSDARKLVQRFQNLFSSSVRKSKIGEHSILLKSSNIVRTPPRRLPLAYAPKVSEMLQEYEELGLIKRSESPFCSPVVIVPKKDGTLRMCCDYRRLNDITVPDSGPIPTFEEIRDALQGGKIFSKVDLRSGYWQMGLTSDSEEMTAFSPGPQYGLWQWTVLPFGLRNAPSSFHREIRKAFHDFKFVLSYIDDLFIFSGSKDEHLTHLEMFFQRCSELNLTLNSKKCTFLVPEIEVLGHMIGCDSVRISPSKLDTIQNWPTPTNKKQLQSFLGLCNYSSRFVRNYTDFTAPLYALTNKGVDFQWTDRSEFCFQTLKRQFSDEICLALPDISKKFVVYTDASNVAISGVITQEGRPIEFCSKILTQSQKRYSTIQRECLAIVFTLKKFRHFLLGTSFTIMSDHKPLIWLREQRLDGMLGRWAIALQEFDFDIMHIDGKSNILADAVSRQFVNALEVDPFISNETLKEEQSEDLILKYVSCSLLDNSNVLCLPDTISPWLRKRWKQLFAQLSVVDGIIVRTFKPSPTDHLHQVPIIPLSLQNEVIRLCHDPPHCGHLGIEKTLARILHVAYWPGIRRSVTDYVGNCKSCKEIKSVVTRLPAQQIVSAATAPGQLVTADILKLPRDNGFSAILLLVDAFSKYPVAFKLRNELASSLVPHFIQYFSMFGIPQRILTDQGTNFESNLLNDVFQFYGVKKLRTSPYHPQTDGETERMNRTILEMLRHYSRNGKWVQYLDLVLQAYRSSCNSVTKHSPALLFLGREINSFPVFQNAELNNFLPSEREFAEILDDVDLHKASKSVSSQSSYCQQFVPNDLVLVRSHVRSKLQPIFDADWRVIAVYDGCISVQKKDKHKTVNIHDVVLQKRGEEV